MFQVMEFISDGMWVCVTCGVACDELQSSIHVCQSVKSSTINNLLHYVVVS